MARHPVPSEVKRLRGTDKLNPQRINRKEPQPTGDLGIPPKHLSAAAKATWFELVAIVPPGVLKNSDRWVVEMASVLMAEFRADPMAFTGAKLTRLETLMARMGMSPVDRPKIVAEQPITEKDPFAEFLQ